MGVDREDYVIIGTKLDYKAECKIHGDNLYDHYCERTAPKPLSVILDGMCGEYIVVGKIIAKASEYEGFKFTPLLNQVSPPVYDEVREALKEFGIVATPEIFIFSHFH